MSGAVPHRDFDTEPVEDLPPSGTFTLGGREWRVRAKEQVSTGFANIFADDKVVAGPFFRATLHPEDIDAFLAMIEEPDGPLTRQRLSPVIDHIAGIVLDRPTKPAGSSSAGSKTTKRKSTAGSSSPGTRQRRSA